MIKIRVFKIKLPLGIASKTRLLSYLSVDEKRSLPKITSKNYDLSLAGKTISKMLISELLKAPVADISIGKTSSGKPYLIKPSNTDCDLSISHSGEYLALAINSKGKIGVDIEILKKFDIDAVKNLFDRREIKYIYSGKTVKNRLQNFLETWTLKEAYLKAIGTGLRKSMPVLRFANENSRKISKEIMYQGEEYRLSSIKTDNFILSVCADRKINNNLLMNNIVVESINSLIMTKVKPRV